MQQLYVLRRFSSWSFRLSVSVALLVSSAGLAASLLVGAAIGNAGAQQLSWQPTTQLAHSTSELSTGQQLAEPALPASLSSLVPVYSFASGRTVGTLQPSLLSSPLATPPASAEPALSPAADSLKSTVQHFWHTFKLAFQ